MSGIFALVCPDCGVPVEDQPESAVYATDGAADRHAEHAADVAGDVHVCAGCTCAFVVRFGYAYAVPHPTDRGAA